MEAGDVMTLERLAPADVQARIQSTPRLLVLFEADWCGYSAMFRPEFEAYAATGSVPAVIADFTHAPDPEWDAFHVATVPTVILYEDGEEIARINGRAIVGIRKKDFRALTANIPEA
jgi:thioredoxin-like negative regulator of GroEL